MAKYSNMDDSQQEPETAEKKNKSKSSAAAAFLKSRRKNENCRSYPEMLAAVALVTISLTEGRSNNQLETLLNFIHLLEQSINYVLAQRIIDEKGSDLIDLDISL